MTISTWDTSTFQCGADRGGLDTEPVANAGQRLAVPVVDDGLIDLLAGRSALLANRRTSRTKDFQNAALGKLVIGCELVG